MNRSQRDSLAKQLDIPKDEQVVLDAGSNHPYECRCEVCMNWWALMGPEDPDDAEPNYGPFSKAEIDALKFRQGQEEDRR